MVLGAEACSLPVIGKERILKDFVADNQTGILIKHSSGEILAEEIIKLYKNVDLKNKMKENCLAFVEKKFNFNDFLDNFKNILD
jgi:glycosyltransferase involved in cell wall biosynthesis